MTKGAVYLMYHELEREGRELCQREPGYVRYVLAEQDFKQHLSQLKTQDLRGLGVGASLDTQVARAGSSPDASAPPHVVITFDDGCETDLLLAAPLLEEAGCGATFYVVTGFLGQRGYMTVRQVRELSERGFEIGSHSHTHSYLTDLGDRQLRAEIRDSKERLEEMTGKRVEHFSCPGGRWDERVAEVAREAGYRSVSTSRPGINSRASDPFALRRVAVMRGTSGAELVRLARAEGLLRQRAQEFALGAAKRLLGNSIYEKVRGAVLD